MNPREGIKGLLRFRRVDDLIRVAFLLLGLLDSLDVRLDFGDFRRPVAGRVSRTELAISFEQTRLDLRDEALALIRTGQLRLPGVPLVIP